MERKTSRRKLAEWLAEWELEQALSLVPEAYPARMERPSRGTELSIGRTDGKLKEGDIVLLPPYGPFTTARPVYVALARQLEDDIWEVVPFSRFSVPAIEDEWSTGRDAEPLKVICPWNRGRLHVPTLLAGWKAEKLTRGEMERLSEDPKDTIGQISTECRGPELIHPLDPRHDYLEEERALWFDREIGEYPESVLHDETPLKAAEKKSGEYD